MRMLFLACAVTASLVAAGGSAGATAPREIAFVGVSAGNGGSDQGVLAVRADGTGVRTIATPGSDPAWSPDGANIVYVSATGLTIVSAQGGEPRNITLGRDSTPSWSPDGKWIAFLRYDGGRNDTRNLYAVRPDGSDLRRLRESTRAFGPWSPDSRSVLISLTRGLATIGLAGHVHLIPNTQRGSSGAWSPNGRWLAFTTARRHADRIAIVHTDGSGFRWLVQPRAVSGDYDPVWAPDSKRLAYVHAEPIGQLDHSEIRMITITGVSLRRLRSASKWHDEYPQWSADGRQVLFERDVAGEPIGPDILCVGDAKSGRTHELYRYVERGTASWRPH